MDLNELGVTAWEICKARDGGAFSGAVASPKVTVVQSREEKASSHVPA